MPPSSSSFDSVRGGSSVATTAESVRNGSHSIIEATASLTRASAMSNDQSIVFDATTVARRGKGVLRFGSEWARRALVLAVFPGLVYITYIIERETVVDQFQSNRPAISFRVQR